jgi:hypothetical protein
MSLTKDNKQATKRNRYSVLSSFYNFSINTALPALANPCNTPVIKKIFKRPQAIQWQIVDKETVDEIIFQNHKYQKQVNAGANGERWDAHRRSFKPHAR